MKMKSEGEKIIIKYKTIPTINNILDEWHVCQKVKFFEERNEVSLNLTHRFIVVLHGPAFQTGFENIQCVTTDYEETQLIPGKVWNV